MSVTRTALLGDLEGYLERYPREWDRLAPLGARITDHQHDGAPSCGLCPVIRTAACVVSEGRRVLHFWHPHSCRWSIKQDAVASGEQCMLHAAYRGLMRTAAVEGLTHDPVHTLPLLIEASRAAVQHSYTYYYLFRTLQEAACCSVMNSAEVAWLPLRDVGNERLRHRLWEATAPLQAADEGAPW